MTNDTIKTMCGLDARQYRCPICSKPMDPGTYQFRDELSAREFRISGMCQECQDSVFGGAE